MKRKKMPRFRPIIEPKFCKVFPNHPDNLEDLPFCSYRFVDVNHKEVIS